MKEQADLKSILKNDSDGSKSGPEEPKRRVSWGSNLAKSRGERQGLKGKEMLKSPGTWNRRRG